MAIDDLAKQVSIDLFWGECSIAHTSCVRKYNSFVHEYFVWSPAWEISRNTFIFWARYFFPVLLPICVVCHICIWTYPDNKVHGANKGTIWVLSAPDGPHVGPMNLAIRVMPGAACVKHMHPLIVWAGNTCHQQPLPPHPRHSICICNFFILWLFGTVLGH